MNGNPADLRQSEIAVVEPCAVAILLEGEGVEAIAALEAWESGFLPALEAAEKRLIRLVEPRQHVLQHMTMDGLVFWERGADGFQFGFLLKS